MAIRRSLARLALRVEADTEPLGSSVRAEAVDHASGAKESAAFHLAASGERAEAVEHLQAERARTLALAAQAFAARPAQTRDGARPVAAATANLRLAALSSFYSCALAQDFLRGPNPITRAERRKVRAYAGAHPLALDDVRTGLAAIDRASPAGGATMRCCWWGCTRVAACRSWPACVART